MYTHMSFQTHMLLFSSGFKKIYIEIIDSNIALVLTCVVTENYALFCNSSCKQARLYITHTKHMILEEIAHEILLL